MAYKISQTMIYLFILQLLQMIFHQVQQLMSLRSHVHAQFIIVILTLIYKHIIKYIFFNLFLIIDQPLKKNKQIFDIDINNQSVQQKLIIKVLQMK
ncbi:hypothetical protein pb186bvf_004307 [Paramecium bursaria]